MGHSMIKPVYDKVIKKLKTFNKKTTGKIRIVYGYSRRRCYIKLFEHWKEDYRWKNMEIYTS